MRGLIATTLVGVLWGWALPAQAFLLVATVDDVPTHWQQQCIPWKMNELGSDDITFEEAHEVVAAAFTTWADVQESFIRFEDQGTTELDIVSPNQGAGENIIMWHEEDEWPYALHVIGLTSLTYDTTTGQIVDADIEMNGDDYRFAIDGSLHAYDSQQALTHEVGHLLGLDHSLDEDATMFAQSQPGESHKRLLAPDDVAGLVFSHPLSEMPKNDGCLDPVITTAPTESGCSTGTPTSLLLALFAMAGCWLCRRRREARVFSLTLVVALAVAGSARAGTAYTTEDGVPLFWPGDTMLYTLHPDLPEELDMSSVEIAIGRGFDAWEPLECQPLTLDLAGWQACPGEDPDDDVNCIRWRDREELWAWPHHLVAVTLVHYWEDTGVIEDVDMDINSFNISWSSELECDPDLHDLIATITHEAGHFLGLDHSLVGQATMNSATTTGDCQKRSLDLDDEETFCGTYESRPEVADASDSDIAVVDLDAQGPSDGGDAGTTPSSGGSRGGGCAGAPLGPWLSLYGITAWLLSTRRRRRGSLLARAR